MTGSPTFYPRDDDPESLEKLQATYGAAWLIVAKIGSMAPWARLWPATVISMHDEGQQVRVEWSCAFACQMFEPAVQFAWNVIHEAVCTDCTVASSLPH